MNRVALLAILSCAAPAGADEPPAPDEPAAPDVAGAPLPGQESGRTDGGEHDSMLRDVGQGVLAVPRLAVEAAMAPVRGSLWAYGHYDLGHRLRQLAFDDTNTYGVVPTLYVDSDYGATIGARFVHRNLFGERERFSLHAGFGGEFNERVDASVHTGDRFGGGAWLDLGGVLERRPKDAFYGIGNNDEATETHHRQELQRTAATLAVPLSNAFDVRLATALTDLRYGRSHEGPPIDMTYDASMLTGWTGTRNLYGELELRWDTRGFRSDHARRGVLLDAFAGRMHQLQAGHDYWRYGGEAIQFMPLAPGRSLATRLHVESVSGSQRDVAFTQLPQLGGKTLLRGYPAERFRDRNALAASGEYFWDLNTFLTASLFVDVGRVYASIDELPNPGMRLGYGTSLQLSWGHHFVGAVSLASSVDGGAFLNLVLDPIYEPEPRVRQR